MLATLFTVALATSSGQTPAECVQQKCLPQTLQCLGDPNCASKVECALSCTTVSCIQGCAGDSPSTATSNLISCAIDNNCVAPGYVEPISAASILGAVPTGSYHGVKDILGVTIDATINIDDATHFDLDISGAASVHCASEVYSYSSGSIALPNEGSSSDCVNQQLSNNGLTFKAVDYDSSTDTITVHVKKSFITLSLTLTKSSNPVSTTNLRGSQMVIV